MQSRFKKNKEGYSLPNYLTEERSSIKPIQKDLAILAMIKDYLKQDLSTLIPHINREHLWAITENNIPDGDTLHNVLKEMALDSYNRVKKKYSK